MIPRWTVTRHSSIEEIDAAAWNACAGTENPFLRHEFFTVLEQSGTACPDTGWQPSHFALFDQDQQRLLAVAPLFLKVHSEGEFVFDYNWAAAYQRAGGSYYPKLQGCVPYTPVPGSRWLTAPDLDPKTAHSAFEWLRQAEVSLAESLRVSSLHVTFCTGAEYDTVTRDPAWLGRLGLQFHFENPGYRDFSDFLSTLSARKRKAILKERREAQAAVEIEVRTGSEIEQRHVDVLYSCYLDTTSRKWGRAALTRQFFHGLRAHMAERVVLMLARRNGKYMAAALNLRGDTVLFGRNWGCLEDVPYLHFELCYYQAIQYAIDHKLTRVEAGAQGFHKVARGYLPRLTYSLHWIRDLGFRRVLRDWLQEERSDIEGQRALIEQEHSPYKRHE